MVELPRLGETPPDPKALPIVETPEPELETTASLSRELEERLEREKKKKKEAKTCRGKKRLEDKRKRRGA